jgi:hypothetical protein
MWMFEALFNGSSPKLSTHALEKCFEHPGFILCSSFQNLRLGSIKLQGAYRTTGFGSMVDIGSVTLGQKGYKMHIALLV